MKCIYCNCTESRVVDSRPTEDGAIRRRRECEQIGRMVMDGLKELDEVAYIRFASVYRQFKDVQSFMEELQLLLDSQKKPQE